jgi:hypothetical protein
VSDIEDSNFFPVLQPNDWRGRRSCVHRRLAGEDGPLVAYAWDSPESSEFLVPAMREEHGWTFAEIHRAAVRNLARREGAPRWTRAKAPGGAPILIREGNEHAAADLLRPKLRRQAHRALECDQIAVAIPCRGVLWACDVGLLVAARLLDLAQEQYDSAAREGRGPVTPHAVLVVEGAIQGLVTSPEGAGAESAPRLDPIAAFRAKWGI